MPWLSPENQGETQGESRELPFALVESGPRGLVLTAVNAAAWKEGVRPGRTLADCRAALLITSRVYGIEGNS